MLETFALLKFGKFGDVQYFVDRKFSNWTCSQTFQVDLIDLIIITFSLATAIDGYLGLTVQRQVAKPEPPSVPSLPHSQGGLKIPCEMTVKMNSSE